MFTPDFPIQTERLLLRPFEAGDFDALFAIESRADVVRFLRIFTDLALGDIAALERAHDPRHLARMLAEHVTRLVHGAEGLAAAQASTHALFGTSTRPRCPRRARLRITQN